MGRNLLTFQAIPGNHINAFDVLFSVLSGFHYIRAHPHFRDSKAEGRASAESLSGAKNTSFLLSLQVCLLPLGQLPFHCSIVIIRKVFLIVWGLFDLATRPYSQSTTNFQASTQIKLLGHLHPTGFEGESAMQGRKFLKWPRVSAA